MFFVKCFVSVVYLQLLSDLSKVLQTLLWELQQGSEITSWANVLMQWLAAKPWLG